MPAAWFLQIARNLTSETKVRVEMGEHREDPAGDGGGRQETCLRRLAPKLGTSARGADYLVAKTFGPRAQHGQNHR